MFWTESVRGACEHGKQSVTASLFPGVLMDVSRSGIRIDLPCSLCWRWRSTGLLQAQLGAYAGGGSRSCRFSIFFVVTFPWDQDAWARELNSKL